MSAPPTELPVGVDIAVAFSGLFWGVLMSLVLQGLNISQGWLYAFNNKDHWALRTQVAILISLDIVISVLDALALNDYLLVHFGDLLHLQTVPRSFNIGSAICHFIVVWLVQLFFAFRLYFLNKRNVYAAMLIFICSCVGNASGMYSGVLSLRGSSFAVLNSQAVRIPFSISRAFNMAADLTATVCLTVELMEVKSHSRVKRSLNILRKLIMFIVTRGMVVTSFTFAIMVVYLGAPHNLNWAPLQIILSKLYIVTMLSILNARSSLKREIDDVDVYTGTGHGGTYGSHHARSAVIPMSSFTGSAAEPESNSWSSHRKNLEIDVHVTKETMGV